MRGLAVESGLRGGPLATRATLCVTEEPAARAYSRLIQLQGPLAGAFLKDIPTYGNRHSVLRVAPPPPPGCDGSSTLPSAPREGGLPRRRAQPRRGGRHRHRGRPAVSLSKMCLEEDPVS